MARLLEGASMVVVSDALSRMGCVVNGRMTIVIHKMSTPPPPISPTLLTPPFDRSTVSRLEEVRETWLKRSADERRSPAQDVTERMLAYQRECEQRAAAQVSPFIGSHACLLVPLVIFLAWLFHVDREAKEADGE